MHKKFSSNQIKLFQKKVHDHYHLYGRSLPWRTTHDPYKILVSEIMLQQTQVDRVLPKYKTFIKAFPNVTVLSKASLSDVLALWQGLGYNRRAKFLRETAIAVIKEYRSIFPRVESELVRLPGIGKYTAGAIMAFAFNLPAVIIETNIRQVYLHHFFKNKSKVADSEILKFIEQTLDTKNPRQWYWALMDYGSYLKKTHGNINAQSKHYTKQSRFKGSSRQVRGNILKDLLEKGPLAPSEFTMYQPLQTEQSLHQLVEERLIKKVGKKFRIA